jgi:hypothetical protein
MLHGRAIRQGANGKATIDLQVKAPGYRPFLARIDMIALLYRGLIDASIVLAIGYRDLQA